MSKKPNDPQDDAPRPSLERDYNALADQVAAKARELVLESEDDIRRLEAACREEEGRTGRRIQPRLSMAVILEGRGVLMEISYGLRVKRVRAFTVPFEGEPDGQEVFPE